MCKKLLVALIAIVCCISIVGCSNNETGNDTKPENGHQNTEDVIISDEEAVEKLNKIYEDITILWNESFCPVTWYVVDGTGSTGEKLDIDFLVLTMDRYYNKLKEDKEIIDKLPDSYTDIKTAFNKLLEKATIIYDAMKKETPKVGETLSYRDDIDLYDQYSGYFAIAISDLQN